MFTSEIELRQDPFVRIYPTMARKAKSQALTLLLIVPLLSLAGVMLYMSKCSPGPPPECPQVDNSRVSNEGIKSVKRDYSAFLVVLIMSGPQLDARRYTIRETWMTKRTKDIIIKFVIGTHGLSGEEKKQLEKESGLHHDLLLLASVHENLKSNTQKLIDSFVWVDRHVDTKFVLKVDDDSIVRLDALSRELRSKNQEKLYWGFFDGRQHAHTRGKYAENDWLLCDHYLPFAIGGGYVLSSDLIHYVAINAKMLKKYNAEDISLGSWLAAVDVNREHDPRFDTEYKSRGCRNVYLISHKQTAQDLKEKWSHLQKTGKMCEKEEQLRQSYVYNWNKPPSECCERVQGVP
ncbi:beta-1,3-galactosyltransferase 6-like isoform X2 [Lytechinus variegatus]|uniref:beta-1,3-galactosyltransferase 6-like isoform X2 n=1 Tax=Lytechinus variegatus TaxID=7654 RepID=UPI001BB0FE02|nr:beta-1,3-galactosyltransferase 6-like isoform X2 [Lytechinus variegatus]